MPIKNNIDFFEKFILKIQSLFLNCHCQFEIFGHIRDNYKNSEYVLFSKNHIFYNIILKLIIS